MGSTDKKAALPLTFEIKYTTLAVKGSILHIRPKSAKRSPEKLHVSVDPNVAIYNQVQPCTDIFEQEGRN